MQAVLFAPDGETCVLRYAMRWNSILGLGDVVRLESSLRHLAREFRQVPRLREFVAVVDEEISLVHSNRVPDVQVFRGDIIEIIVR